MHDSDQESALTLVIDTPEGPFLRVVPEAMPLVAGMAPGYAAEEATRSAVVRWGMPDFVFQPIVAAKGKGRREVGDVLLLQGNRGVILQVKHRVKASDESQRETNWAQKAGVAAVRQANGTARTLRGAGIELRNLRGRSVSASPTVSWLAAIVLDHPNLPPGTVVDTSAAKLPVVALLRRDWEFLFDQLRSTYAVMQYLHRIADQEPIALGDEPIRYYEFAGADANAPPNPLDKTILGDGRPLSVPLLPATPAGRDNTSAHLLLRVIMEDIAVSLMEGDHTEEDRVSVLAELDQVPVSHRTELGRHVRSMFEDVIAATPDCILWRFRSYRLGPASPHLLFGACTRLDEYTREAFRQWVMLRHHEFGAAIGATDLHSVGVLLTPRDDGLRPWDTTMVAIRGDLEFTQEELASFRQLWNSPAA